MFAALKPGWMFSTLFPCWFYSNAPASLGIGGRQHEDICTDKLVWGWTLVVCLLGWGWLIVLGLCWQFTSAEALKQGCGARSSEEQCTEQSCRINPCPNVVLPSIPVEFHLFISGWFSSLLKSLWVLFLSISALGFSSRLVSPAGLIMWVIGIV